MNTYTFTNVHELDEFLRRYGVPVWNYGLNQAKTLEQLLEEVKKGECRLSVEEGRVVRSIKAVCLNVYQNGRVLVEEKQIFADGRKRRRPWCRASLAEKVKCGIETLAEALERLMWEEARRLLFCGHVTPSTVTKIEWGESHSYPGLLTRYEFFFNEVFIQREMRLPLIVQEADGKVAHYRWDEL